MNPIPCEANITLNDIRKLEFGNVNIHQLSIETIDYDPDFRLPKEKFELKDIPFAFTEKINVKPEEN